MFIPQIFKLIEIKPQESTSKFKIHESLLIKQLSMCNSLRLVLMNASLINSKQVENDITKTLRDFFSQVTETPTS